MDLAWDSSGTKTTLKMHFTPEIIAKFCARPREMFGFFRLFLSFSFLVPKAGKCVKNTKSSSPTPEEITGSPYQGKAFSEKD